MQMVKKVLFVAVIALVVSVAFDKIKSRLPM
jgi:hypothetical protein